MAQGKHTHIVSPPADLAIGKALSAEKTPAASGQGVVASSSGKVVAILGLGFGSLAANKTVALGPGAGSSALAAASMRADEILGTNDGASAVAVISGQTVGDGALVLG